MEISDFVYIVLCVFLIIQNSDKLTLTFLCVAWKSFPKKILSLGYTIKH